MNTNQFDNNYIYNNDLGWRERTFFQKAEKTGKNILYAIGEPFVDTNPNLSFENEFDRNYIYNSQVGWRERTETERASENLDRRFGPTLESVGGGVMSILQYVAASTPTALKFLAIGVGAGAAATVVWNSVQVVRKVAQS
mgnify:CR=1 FL=1